MASTSSDTGINDSYYGDASGSCGLPRNLYYPYEPGIVYTATSSEDGREEVSLSNDKTVEFDNYLAKSHIECKYSAGVLGNESCDDIGGCEWETDQSLWDSFLNLFGSGEEPTETCTGRISYADFDSNRNIINGMRVISPHYNPEGEGVCYHPDVITNESLCRTLSCTWSEGKVLDDIDLEGVTPSRGLVGSTWDTVKDLVTFQYDFGIEDETGESVINFFLFHLPLLGILLSLYVLVRS